MSLSKTIADAVKTAIETLTGEPTVVVREQPWTTEGDTLPLVIVSVGEEEPAGYAAGASVLREYAVVVTVIYARNQKLEGSAQDTAKDWRDQIRKRLVPDSSVSPGSILSGVAAVWDVEAVTLPTEDGARYGANHQTAMLGLRYRTSEATHA